MEGKKETWPKIVVCVNNTFANCGDFVKKKVGTKTLNLETIKVVFSSSREWSKESYTYINAYNM